MQQETLQETTIARVSHAPGGLVGELTVPGDKSITHRAYFFAALNSPQHTQIVNPSPAQDCLHTRDALARLGYSIEVKDNAVFFSGEKVGHYAPEEELILDAGNSGTTVRLLMGFLTGESGRFRIEGDASLSRRPMERVAAPLRSLGTEIKTDGGHLPAIIFGDGVIDGWPSPLPIRVHSAQVHASLIIAGLRSSSGYAIERISGMRDHTLRIMSKFGWDMGVTSGSTDIIVPISSRNNVAITIPGDISSAAFFVAAAILLPGSAITIKDVGLNPTRLAFLKALQEMGADLIIEALESDFEPYGRITAKYSPHLRASSLLDAETSTSAVAEMIDELPLLAFVASQATGTTIIQGAEELRVKESDRITATAALLADIGIEIQTTDDGFIVHGPQTVRGGSIANHSGDHRLCMLAAIAGLIAQEPVIIPENEVASVSYPNFWKDLAAIAPHSIAYIV